MKFHSASFQLIALFFTLQGCNTLYNSKTTDIEILVPGKAKIPTDYKKMAVQYNNCNADWNPVFAQYFEDSTKLIDYSNTDSIASWIYFQTFVDQIREQQFFDTIIDRKPILYTGVTLHDSLVTQRIVNLNIRDSFKTTTINPAILKIVNLADFLIPTENSKKTILLIDPDFGLHTKNKIGIIAQETGADFFLSFDFFAAADAIYTPKFFSSLPDSLKNNYIKHISTPSLNVQEIKGRNGKSSFQFDLRNAAEMVYVLANWNIYDLKKQELTYSYYKIDSIKWTDDAYALRDAKKKLPPRLDAVYNAADIAGAAFAEYLSPHWITVQRIYYQSGHVELRKAEELMLNQRWIEAAEIWKHNVYNKNKKIAAKSMYNMALACEMTGELDAAMDWAIKSFYVFGNKNQVHAFNCNDYIKIIAQRKLDIRKIEN